MRHITHKVVTLFLLGSLFLAGCMNGDSHSKSRGLRNDSSRSANGFEILETASGHLLHVFDPWNSKDTLGKYFVASAGAAVPDGYLSLSLPLKRWAVFSTTHIGFLEELGMADLVIGCTTPDRVYNQNLYDKYKRGELIRIGSDMEYSFEDLVMQKPDVVIQTGFPGQRNKDRQLFQAGIQPVYVLEWLESTALGRAEWIKVFGLLTGTLDLADSIFREVKSSYINLKKSVPDKSEKPGVLIGNNFKGTWYMPGGQNYMAGLLSDAGFYYPWAATEERGSLALGFETVLHKFIDMPFWVGVSFKEPEGMTLEDSRYSVFRSFREEQVYSVNGKIKDDYRNDFWEGAVARPDYVLADLLSISHPEILKDYKMIYYKKLQ